MPVASYVYWRFWRLAFFASVDWTHKEVGAVLSVKRWHLCIYLWCFTIIFGKK